MVWPKDDVLSDSMAQFKASKAHTGVSTSTTLYAPSQQDPKGYVKDLDSALLIGLVSPCQRIALCFMSFSFLWAFVSVCVCCQCSSCDLLHHHNHRTHTFSHSLFLLYSTYTIIGRRRVRRPHHRPGRQPPGDHGRLFDFVDSRAPEVLFIPSYERLTVLLLLVDDSPLPPPPYYTITGQLH